MNILMGTLTPTLYLFRTQRSIFVMTPKRVLESTGNRTVNKLSKFTKDELYEFIASYYDRSTVSIESFCRE